MTITWHTLFSRRLYRVGLAIFFVGTLYLMFSQPGQVKVGLYINDKMAHAITFFILTLLFSRGLPQYYGLWALVGLAVFGFIIEGIQYFVPWRSFSVADWIADVVGIVLYHILHLIRVRFVKVKRARRIA